MIASSLVRRSLVGLVVFAFIVALGVFLSAASERGRGQAGTTPLSAASATGGLSAAGSGADGSSLHLGRPLRTAPTRTLTAPPRAGRGS